MSTREKKNPKDQLEEQRTCLNEKIINNNMNLTDPDIIAASRELDVMVVDEMRRAV